MNVLLVEDSADDVAAVQRLVESNTPPVTLTVVCDGDEALAYVAANAAGGPRPQLILLDLQLPGTPGIELLQRIKTHPELHDVPVVMLTGSDRDRDVREAQDLGAHSYMRKPMTARDFAWIARSIASYQTRLALITQAETSRKEKEQ